MTDKDDRLYFAHISESIGKIGEYTAGSPRLVTSIGSSSARATVQDQDPTSQIAPER